MNINKKYPADIKEFIAFARKDIAQGVELELLKDVGKINDLLIAEKSLLNEIKLDMARTFLSQKYKDKKE